MDVVNSRGFLFFFFWNERNWNSTVEIFQECYKRGWFASLFNGTIIIISEFKITWKHVVREFFVSQENFNT